MRRFGFFLGVLLAVASLNACVRFGEGGSSGGGGVVAAPRNDVAAAMGRIKKGQSASELEAAVGRPPYDISGAGTAREVRRFYWSAEKKGIEVVLENGAVASWRETGAIGGH